MFGVHGLCGQRALPVVVQEPERENDHAIALLLDMVENPALVQSDKWVIAIIDLAQVKKRNSPLCQIQVVENILGFAST